MLSVAGLTLLVTYAAHQGRHLACSQLQRLWRQPDPAVPGLDPVPQFPARQSQAGLQTARPLRHLSADCRNLYALPAGDTAGLNRLDTILRYLAAGAAGHHLQSHVPPPVQETVSRHLHHHGWLAILAGKELASTLSASGMAG